MFKENLYLRLCFLHGKLKYIDENDLYSSKIGWSYVSNTSLDKVFIFKTKLGPRILNIREDDNHVITVEYLINYNYDYNTLIFKIQASKHSVDVLFRTIDDMQIDLALYEIERIVEYYLAD